MAKHAVFVIELLSCVSVQLSILASQLRSYLTHSIEKYTPEVMQLLCSGSLSVDVFGLFDDLLLALQCAQINQLAGIHDQMETI